MKLALTLLLSFCCNPWTLGQGTSNIPGPNKNTISQREAMERQMQLIHQRQLELMKKLTEGLKGNQMHMNQFFDDQFFKQADQMFKQIQDQGSPFGQIIQQFQQGFQKGLKDDFENTHSPRQWQESDKGMSFVLPYVLNPKDKIDLKIKKGQVFIDIQHWQNSDFSGSQSYQFPIPKGCNPAMMDIIKDQKRGETKILFPWIKRLQKVVPSHSDKVI